MSVRPRGRRAGGTGTATGHGDTGRSAFWKFWTASVVSQTGTGVTAVALPLLALVTLNASNFEIGLLTAAGYAAVVVIGLPAGVIVQRYPLRTLQVTMDLARALALATVPLAVLWDSLTLLHLVLVALLVGLATNLYDVANATFLPRIVTREELTTRNGLVSSTQAVTTMAGPALGGALVQAVGAATVVVVDVVSYLVSAVVLGRIRVRGEAPADPTPDEPVVRRISVGLRYVFAHPVLRPAVIAASAVNLATGAVLAVMAPFLVRTLGLPPGVVGLGLVADGVGTVLGATATARLAGRWGTARVMVVATVVGGLVSLAMPLAVGPAALALFCFGMVGMTGGIAILAVIARTHRQTVPPPELLARVMASVRFVSWTTIPVGALLAGVLAEVWGPRAGLVLVTAAALLAPAVLLTSRVRTLRDLTDCEPTAVG